MLVGGASIERSRGGCQSWETRTAIDRQQGGQSTCGGVECTDQPAQLPPTLWTSNDKRAKDARSESVRFNEKRVGRTEVPVAFWKKMKERRRRRIKTERDRETCLKDESGLVVDEDDSDEEERLQTTARTTVTASLLSL